MKRARTIAEFFILQWLESRNLDVRYVDLEFITNHRARVTDCNNDTMVVAYDEDDHYVYLENDETPAGGAARESGI